MKAYIQTVARITTCTAMMSVVCVRAAHAEVGFLWMPFSDTYDPYVTCRWTCPNSDGSPYIHHATDYGRTGHTTEVRSSAAGIVQFVERAVPQDAHLRGIPYGNRVEILHPNGYVSIYAHLLPEIVVTEGDVVGAGDLLGHTDNSGKSTGPHLHFEVRDPDGNKVNPYGDPPDYEGGCGTGALWISCPPEPTPPEYRDADHDGFTPVAGDCDDTTALVNPSTMERCDYADNNCNGATDENWHEGLAVDLGMECDVGFGNCRRFGEYICTPDGRAVVCNADAGEPHEEVCDGLDNNCDQETDETFEDLGETCAYDWSVCSDIGITTGVKICSPDRHGTICNAPAPDTYSGEVCDGFDNDCDGSTDDVMIASLDEDAANCGDCFNNCAAVLVPGSVCENGHCFVRCGDKTSHGLCNEFCRIRHCPDCGLGCDSGYDTCLNECVIDPSYVIGNDYGGQACACDGCEDCCCLTSGPFTECYFPCLPW